MPAAASLPQLDRAQNTVLVFIILDGVILGLETSGPIMASHGTWVRLLYKALLSMFVLEIGLRIIAWRGAFLRHP